MRNRFGIPKSVLEKMKLRDSNCVYCHKKMIFPYDAKNQKDSATIEHFKEKGPFYWWDGLEEKEIAYCCGSCNSSRSNLSLNDWFKEQYCLARNINQATVADPVKPYIIALS